MKKTNVSILFIFLLITSSIFIFYVMSSKTIESAMLKANIMYQDILHQTEYKDFSIIFYTYNDNLSVGLLKKSLLGYKWEFGGGSDHFSQKGPITWELNNFSVAKLFNENEIVTITKGAIHDNQINDITIHYNDSDAKASIVKTSRGRFWYSFSQSPINYKPDITIDYLDGSSKKGWP